MDTFLFPLLLQVVLIALNAIFACAEIAVISLNDSKVAKMAEDGNRRAKRLQRFVEQPSSFLSTIQIAITLSGFLGSAFAADNFSDTLTEVLLAAGVPLSAKVLDTISVIVITVILSYFTLIFGELVPKRLAMKKSEQLAMAMSAMLTMVAKIFAPIVWVLTMSTNGILRLLGIDPNADDEEISEEEIQTMVDAGTRKGVFDVQEQQFIQNICVGLGGAVEQHNGAGVDAGQQLVIGLFRRGLLVGVPVHIGQAPENRLVSQCLGLFQIAFAEFPLGRAVIFFHLFPGDFLVFFLHGGKFFPETVQIGDLGHIRVIIGVVAHNMPFVHHPLHQLRRGLQKISHHKKGGFGIVLFQCVQNGGGTAVFEAAVKCEVNGLLLGISQVTGVVSGKIFAGGVAHRCFPFFLEAQTPVGVGGRGRHSRRGGGEKREHQGKGQGGGEQKQRWPTKDFFQQNTSHLSVKMEHLYEKIRLCIRESAFLTKYSHKNRWVMV